ncbi:GNAT family N-acetyltransferase [Streptomyces apocyni]|uniref:GNAT family N-acetyltransferase n=1 Tax=Streptomyces apocyni TaxID=2654677 RepID=UPI0012EA2BF0|nr:GNAT family N-acetyltransferase [Streptomyces apocyni]
MTTWTIAPEDVDSADAAALWAAYYTEVSDRWFEREYGPGHSTPADELEREIAAETGADLAPPNGALLIARYDGEAAGCAGVRLIDVRTAELKRVFVRKEMRGKGAGRVLIPAVEDVARALGAERAVLDTRLDLIEARTLYSRHGYREIPAYNDGEDNPYAEIWYGKDL